MAGLANVKTRNKTACPLFGLGSDLNKRVLPTYYDVMKCYYIYVRDNLMPEVNSKEPTFYDISQIVIQKVKAQWERASIPEASLLSKPRIVKMLKDYHKKCAGIKKDSHRKDIFKIKADSFLSHAKATLFDIARCKCKDFLSCKCNKNKKIPKLEQQFLTDQRTVRKMAIGNVDFATTKQINRREERKLVMKRRLDKDNLDAVSFRKTIDLEDEKTEENEATEEEGETEDFCKMQNVPSTSSGIKSSQMRKCLPTLALECDRSGVSDRSAARIASAVLKDFGIVLTNETNNVIDRSKIRRARKRQRNALQTSGTLETQYPQSVYFDGRKDRTLKMEKRGNKYYRASVVEEHIVLIEEPNSKYMGHVNPQSGTSSSCARSILNYLKSKADLSQLVALGCDGTATNTGSKGGILRLIELDLKRNLHWFVCQLHGNELPLRHLFNSLDGKTTGPKSFSGPLGVLLQRCETLPIVEFNKIDSEIPLLDKKDLSSDQKYLLEMSQAVTVGHVPEDLARRNPGRLAHSRWVTCANRILRLYVATSNPSENLVKLATYVVKVYAPIWFRIKMNNLCTNGAENLFYLIKRSRYLDESDRVHVDSAIQRNAYFAHPENLLLCMVADPRRHIRELALRRILKARSSKKDSDKQNIRVFKIPKLNFEAEDYSDIVDWQNIEVSDPPALSKYLDEELKSFITTGEIPEIPGFPCHTQTVERHIKLVTEASSSVCGQVRRDGFIRSKIKSKSLVPKFETKKEYKV